MVTPQLLRETNLGSNAQANADALFGQTLGFGGMAAGRLWLPRI